jgi:uncharacterized membrane protein YdjX (TVP38/TMEM64 family)
MQPDVPRVPASRIPRSVRRAVLGLFIVGFVAGAVYLWRTGKVTPNTVGTWLDSLGPAAPVIFIAAFVGGSFAGLPGMAFVIGGRLAFGPWLGFAVGFGGGLLAVTIPFVTARALRHAGSDPWRPKHRWLARAFALVETHPFRAVLVLRLVLWFNPPLSYALAFAAVPLRLYVAACAIALAPVVALAMVATSWFMS